MKSSDVQTVVQEALPDTESRLNALRLFAKFIRTADSAAPANWSVHAETNRVRLVVGPVRACTIRPGALWLALDAETGCTATRLLLASHIKPWRISSDEERLNRHNGLLLVPNLDAAFDEGDISFSDHGDILISSSLNANECAILGIDPSMRLRRIEPEHQEFLEFHRSEIFSKE